jgi:hypothetical protein
MLKNLKLYAQVSIIIDILVSLLHLSKIWVDVSYQFKVYCVGFHVIYMNQLIEIVQINVIQVHAHIACMVYHSISNFLLASLVKKHEVIFLGLQHLRDLSCLVEYYYCPS